MKPFFFFGCLSITHVGNRLNETALYFKNETWRSRQDFNDKKIKTTDRLHFDKYFCKNFQIFLLWYLDWEFLLNLKLYNYFWLKNGMNITNLCVYATTTKFGDFLAFHVKKKGFLISSISHQSSFCVQSTSLMWLLCLPCTLYIHLCHSNHLTLFTFVFLLLLHFLLVSFARSITFGLSWNVLKLLFLV